MRKLITERVARAAKPAAERYEIRDTLLPGFGLRVAPSGARSWSYTYGPRTARRRLDLGDYPFVDATRAREEAKRAAEVVRSGKDPKAGQRGGPVRMMVADLCELYVEHAKTRKHPSSVYQDGRIIARFILPEWGHRPAESVTRSEVRDLVGRVAAETPTQANRLLALISSMWTWAVTHDRLTVNPAYRVPKPGRERRKTRVLADHEIAAVWRASGEASTPLGMVYRLMLLTGQRPSEVRTMRWVDIAGEWWMLPPASTKSGRPHRVYLTSTARQIAEGMRESPTQLYVFPARITRRAGMPAARSRVAYYAVVERSGVTGWTPHDLRRTAATKLASLGIQREIVRRILNHADASITAVYDLYTYDREVAEALTRLETEIMRIVAGSTVEQPAPLQPAP